MDDATKTYLDTKFAGIDAKFVNIDEKFAGIDAKFTALDETMNKRFDELASTQADILTLIDTRFNKAEERLDKIEEKLEPLEPLVNQVSGHEKRIKFLEERTLPKPQAA